MRILLRCDGAAQTGVGHVVRCVALAEEALSRGHQVTLLGTLEGEFLQALVGGTEGLSWAGPAPGAEADVAAVLSGHDVVHVDSYDFADLTAALSLLDSPPLVSAMHDGEFGLTTADITIDATPSAEVSEIPRTAKWSLRGGRYIPIRGSVLRHAPTHDSVEQSGRSADLEVLVVLGGTDPTGSAPSLARALLAADVPLTATVVATSGTREELDDLALGSGGRLVVSEPLTDLAARIAASDLVLAAAGSTVWEVCALRRPMAVTMAAENQRVGYTELVNRGAAVGLGDTRDVQDTMATAALLRDVLLDAGVRDQLASAAHHLVDGLGAWRIVSTWEVAVAGGVAHTRDVGEVRARQVTEGDAAVLWTWRNDPSTRQVSRNPEEIPYAAHLEWVRSSLGRSDRLLLVAEDDEGAVGTVRLDREEPGAWEVSITVAPERRGQGLARPLLAAGEASLAHLRPREARRLLAVVHEQNAASLRLFLSSGYVPDLSADRDGFARWTKLV